MNPTSQIMTFTGRGNASPFASDADLNARARAALEANDWGVVSVDIRSVGGALQSIVDFTIKITGPCPSNQSYSSIAAGIRGSISGWDGSPLQNTTCYFDRSTGCTAPSVPAPTPTRTPTPRPSSTPTINGGVLATVDVKIPDEEETDYTLLYVLGAVALALIL